MILSVAKTKIAPNKNPPATGTNAYSLFFPYIPDFSASSMAGPNNDQNDAAIITPAANPSAMSNDFLYAIEIKRSVNKLPVDIGVESTLSPFVWIQISCEMCIVKFVYFFK